MTQTQRSAISRVVRGAATLLAAALAALALVACGSSSDETSLLPVTPAEAGEAGTGGPEANAPAPAALTAADLTPSFAQAAIAFGSRGDSVLRASLDRSLGKGAALALKPEGAECRPASATPSDADSERFPFACIIEGTGASGGVSTTFTLGFVVFGIKGRCWRAANERISASAGPPVLIPQDTALAPENVIRGCAAS